MCGATENNYPRTKVRGLRILKANDIFPENIDHVEDCSECRSLKDNSMLGLLWAVIMKASFLCFEARETHCSPKHTNWFNAAKIEINVMNVECTGKRVNDIETLTHELAAWTKKE